MIVTPLPGSIPLDVDAPLDSATPATTNPSSFAGALAGALDDASSALAKADGAERAFANGRGGMQEMVLQRAQADIALSVASAAASRTAQALGTILNMQV